MTMHKYLKPKLKAPTTMARTPVGADSLIKQTDYSVDASGPEGDENRPPKMTKK